VLKHVLQNGWTFDSLFISFSYVHAITLCRSVVYRASLAGSFCEKLIGKTRLGVLYYTKDEYTVYIFFFTNLFRLASQLICTVAKIVRGRHWYIRILKRKLNGLDLKFDAKIKNLWRFNSASIYT
jgi:hypothetical protein